ncbi:MAG: hypothetical protein M3Q39_00495 [Actinomycetota bacterium]|nr:hypothetical protein [Actinomycetota bacterium]
MARGEIYFQMAANFADDPKVRKLVRYGADARGCRDLFVQMIGYCKLNLTDGFVPEEQVGIMCYPDTWDNAQRDAGRLVDVGLIERVDEGFYVSAFLKRNKTREDIENEAEAKSAAAIRTNHLRWHEKSGRIDPKCPLCSVPKTPGRIAPDRSSDHSSDRLHGVASESTETETESETETKSKRSKNVSPVADAPARLDVEQICKHLADRIEANGSKRPTITKAWRESARLLVDKDGYTVEQILKAIDWCQADGFWRANILSMPKLREKYDQLRLQATRELQPTGRTSGANRFNNDDRPDSNPFANGANATVASQAVGANA